MAGAVSGNDFKKLFMKNETLVSVIIPVYNNERYLETCLTSVFKSLYPFFEVIVVDDHSSDISLAVAKSYHCKVISLEKNVGPAEARNIGVRSAQGAILFFLDSDILIEKNTIGTIVQTFQEKPEISALFCSFQKKTLPSNFFSVYKNFVHHYTHQNSRPEAATFCSGFGAIKRNIFLNMGGFNSQYRSLEDIEFGYRLHKAGHRIFLNKDIQVTHCKYYTFMDLVKSDLLNRAIPWTKIMLQQKIFKNDLNTKVTNILSVLMAFLIFLCLPLLPAYPKFSVALILFTAFFLLLNSKFYSFLAKVQGRGFATKAILMNWFSYLYSGVGFIFGILAFVKDDLPASMARKD